MKKHFCLLFLLVFPVIIFAQITIDFPIFQMLNSYTYELRTLKPYLTNTDISFNGRRIQQEKSTIGFYNFSITDRNTINLQSTIIYAEIDEKIIWSDNKDILISSFSHDSNKIIGSVYEKNLFVMGSIVVYQNNEAFVRQFMDEDAYRMKKYNFDTLTISDVLFGGSEFYGEVNDISADKQVLLVSDHYEAPPSIHIWDIQNNSDYSVIEYSHNRTIRNPMQFLTNSIFLLAPKYADRTRMWEVYSIEGKLIDRFQFPDNQGRYYDYIYFTPDLMHAMAFNMSTTGPWPTYILDTHEFRKYFEDRGLLFEQTTATVNDSHVRVRQYANLEAKHIGFLEKGDKVQVLDRSALQRTIDPWGEHYWYQIKRESDGLEGWIFGAFLEMGE